MENLQNHTTTYLNYCQAQKRLDTKTLKAYEIDLRQFVDSIPTKNINNISSSILENYIATLHQLYKPKTIKRKIASLKAFFRYLEYKELIEKNPFNKIQIKFREPIILPKTIPLHTIELILKTLYEQHINAKTAYQRKNALRNVAVIELLFATGMRISELCSLRTCDVNMYEQIILIHGKGSKERRIQIGNDDVAKILQEYEAIDALLDYVKITFEDIQYIGITFSSVNIYELKQYYQEELSHHYNTTNFTIVPTSHHMAHAESAFCTSDFEKALILIADGGGDNFGKLTEAESLFLGVGSQITKLEERHQIPPVNTIYKKQNYIYPFMNKQHINYPISIGRKYEQITYMLGFKWGECGKTMGLASYGKSLLNFSNFNIYNFNFNLSLGDLIQEIYTKYLASGQTYYQFLATERANIAQTVQELTETILTQLISQFTQKYGIYDVCLAGGTFLNCMLNHKLLENIPKLRLHICPASGDDGQAVGAAFHAYKTFIIS